MFSGDLDLNMFFFCPPSIDLLPCLLRSSPLPLLTSCLSHATRALVLQLAPLQEHMRPPQACWTGPTVSNPQSRASRQSKAKHPMKHGNCRFCSFNFHFSANQPFRFSMQRNLLCVQIHSYNYRYFFLSVSVVQGKILTLCRYTLGR